MDFNINHKAKVKLTSYGIEILINRHYEFEERMKNMNPAYEKKPFTLKLDEEGYYVANYGRLFKHSAGITCL